MNYQRYHHHQHEHTETVTATPAMTTTAPVPYWRLRYAARATERQLMKRKGWVRVHGLEGWYVPTRKVTS